MVKQHLAVMLHTNEISCFLTVVKSAPSVNVFESRLKTHIFSFACDSSFSHLIVFYYHLFISILIHVCPIYASL